MVQTLSSRKKFLTKSAVNNMRKVKIEFQENNNGLRFCTQTVVPYGNISLGVSFPNDISFFISK